MAHVDYVRFGDDKVSKPWATVLRAAARAGVIAITDLDDGHRSMALQAQRVREHGLYNAITNPHGAAAPSATAPHIKLGHIDHAIDVNALNGAVTRLDAWVAAHGEQLARTVPTEAWHREIVGGEAALRRLARKVSDPVAAFPKGEAAAIRAYDRLKKSGRHKDRLAELRHRMVGQRKAVWLAGERHGWEKHHRRARYRALLARTT